MSELWERQEYDTDVSFDRFQRYYLAQEPSRSVNEAWRRWYAEKHQIGADQVPKRPANGNWKQWAWPKDGLSWPERAKAFDDHLAQLRIAKWEARHMPESEVLALLADQARGDIGDFADIQHSTDLANHPLSRIVKKYKKRIYHPKDTDSYDEIELELYDAHAPLVDLGKAHALFTDKIDASVKIDGRLVILPKQDG